VIYQVRSLVTPQWRAGWPDPPAPIRPVP